MYEKKIPDVLDCGLSVGIKVIGGKWKAWLIDAIKRGNQRPVELHREMGSEVSMRVISMMLRELEDYGILSKKVYAEVPLRVEYSLTKAGQELLPVLDLLDKWGDRNRETVVGKELTVSR
ncbi:MAG TPA: helix-turn-helix domain-containing protein [Chitinophaga sp.]|uniref:winged helix-turn-helix transcriptional regulator n=1 Tax=Chitinophaga sp. TaxID=1869181 RepID=UPI002D048B50|nr:helix-turn-helix domain-containing protein [Chitinophaga sp.]HVI44371.1 helix-turn-helix domain-containing protein [Chitinophaga sp.]